MANPLLTYSKTILRKVSFDPFLFRREYRKALRVLNSAERHALKNWIRTGG